MACNSFSCSSTTSYLATEFSQRNDPKRHQSSLASILFFSMLHGAPSSDDCTRIKDDRSWRHGAQELHGIDVSQSQDTEAFLHQLSSSMKWSLMDFVFVSRSYEVELFFFSLLFFLGLSLFNCTTLFSQHFLFFVSARPVANQDGELLRATFSKVGRLGSCHLPLIASDYPHNQKAQWFAKSETCPKRAHNSPRLNTHCLCSREHCALLRIPVSHS